MKTGWHDMGVNPEPPLVIRPTPLGLFAAWFFLVVSPTWGVVALPVLLVLHPPPSGGDAVVIVILNELVAACAVWFAWRSTRLAIVANDDGLLVRNIFGDRGIPIDEIERFDVGWAYWGISVRLLDGRRVILNAVQKSNAAGLLRRRVRADDAVDQLNAWLNGRRGAARAALN